MLGQRERRQGCGQHRDYGQVTAFAEPPHGDPDQRGGDQRRPAAT
jgi:hypothetical protein